MTDDRIKWNERYQKQEGLHAPSSIIQRYHSISNGQKALDLACGNGRNSLFLAEQGYRVDAVDISDVALERLKGRHPGIQTICRDLDAWQIPSNTYDLICNIRYLNRTLFKSIIDGLKPGGILLFESFTGKKTTAYCLKENELLDAFSDLHIFFYEETENRPDSKFEITVKMAAVKNSS